MIQGREKYWGFQYTSFRETFISLFAVWLPWLSVALLFYLFRKSSDLCLENIYPVMQSEEAWKIREEILTHLNKLCVDLVFSFIFTSTSKSTRCNVVHFLSVWRSFFCCLIPVFFSLLA